MRHAVNKTKTLQIDCTPIRLDGWPFLSLPLTGFGFLCDCFLRFVMILLHVTDKYSNAVIDAMRRRHYLRDRDRFQYATINTKTQISTFRFVCVSLIPWKVLRSVLMKNERGRRGSDVSSADSLINYIISCRHRFAFA